MACTREDRKRWLEEAKKAGASHMLVVCDTFDYEDYPVNIMPGENARAKAEQYTPDTMQRVMECFSLSMDFDEQLAGGMTLNYD